MIQGRGICPKCDSNKVIKRVIASTSDEPDHICIQCNHIDEYQEFNKATIEQEGIDSVNSEQSLA